jgi:hypothetical protein
MHIGTHGMSARPGGLSGGSGLKQPGGNGSGGDFAALIEAQSNAGIAPPVGGGSTGKAPPVGGAGGGKTGIAPPVGTARPADPASINPMMGAFAGVASMLEDLVPITEFGGGDAVEPQSFDPKSPPAGNPAEDAAIAAMNAASVFGPLDSLLLLNKI